ncbi:hypothetical protein FEM48_Zijuj08G0071300 [Ziziphus jujuba var. spinosa]|uniref:DCD domain-containing protein n=1 Tax=Ziziphus jujuba var. spinosa TaxID=714518 RepID=A0A978UXP4_ZIZJJ|nr:hypothetical protein FEM48_Zijuj08G0071300 [Ziziphus jujuba var. spinosa]
MSRTNYSTSGSTATAAATGGSLWQFGRGFGQVLASVDEYQTWRATALDNQLGLSERKLKVNHQDDDVDDDLNHRIKTSSFNNIQLRLFPEMKAHQPIYLQQQHQVQQQQQLQTDKWHKTLPPAEMLPRNEVLGGYIFVCNNETMQEDLRRQLFGLPQKYKDSVRAITPGLPLFLYNYTAHQLHGVYQAASFGGSNIDPTAWEDRKCKGESRFPAQVRIQIKKNCKPLEEDAFRPILYHYDGPKFRLQLSVPEALALLDLFKEEDY